MKALNHPFLLGAGALLLVIGYLLRSWASKHDLKGLAVDAAWQVAKARGDLKAETELGNRIKGLAAEESKVAQAKMVAGHAGRHVAAQIAGLAGLIALLGGAGLIGLAFYL